MTSCVMRSLLPNLALGMTYFCQQLCKSTEADKHKLSKCNMFVTDVVGGVRASAQRGQLLAGRGASCGGGDE